MRRASEEQEPFLIALRDAEVPSIVPGLAARHRSKPIEFPESEAALGLDRRTTQGACQWLVWE